MHGHRGIIYLTKYKGIKVAIKKKLPRSEAIDRIQNEIKFLKILNKHKIGPKILKHTKDSFTYKFINGIFIKEFLEKEKSKTKIKKILKQVFEQCYKMDKLGINKLEMHNPFKHIIITPRLKAHLVDFERCYYTKDPKNVTQFCQYIRRNQKLLNKKGFKINKKQVIKAAKEYKKDKNLSNILKKTFRN